MSQSDQAVKVSSEQGAAHQIADLANQLRVKDELVVQLTERLEQTVEQLDRLHRSGADRGAGNRPGGGGDGSAFASRLEEALENWGQANEQYDAIIERLDGLFELIEKGGGKSTSPSSSASPRSSPTPPASPRSTSVASASGSSAPATGSYWDKMKASMMEGAPTPSASSTVSSSPVAAVSVTTDAVNEPGLGRNPQEPLIINDLPPPEVVDVETADIEQLRIAVTERDKYIVALISQFRTIESLPPMPQDLDKAELAPEELVLSLRELESRLKAKIQREELDLSIERAKMARERAKLDAIKGQLEAQIRRLAAGAAPEQTSSAESPKVDGHGRSLGWLNRLRGNPKSE
ncbi:MAG: hypothetical protein DWH91_05375 [Planctomycetota bacterium]|nr:MAG: hypothetical protein DWH91_05375 [Planctomycetota bacterium]